MWKARSDSPVSRRIVLAFLDFLNSVELSPGVDSEAIEVVKDCLETSFDLNSPCNVERIPPNMLLELFSSLESSEQDRLRPDLDSHPIQNKASCSATTSQTKEDANNCTTSNSEGPADDPIDLDELFGKFYAALDQINFFKTSPAGVEDPSQIEKATQFFDDALQEARKSGKEAISLGDLAEFFKSKGNELVRSKQYAKAIELYTCAIALCRKNAIYYCNRAAAYTLLQMYNEAIEDCMKSIEIDPGYSKAYSRLGSAYFAQGNYHDALHKGYLKASQLDPSNETIRENIEVAKRKLVEQRAPSEEQNMHTRQGQESGTQPTDPTNNGSPFTSFSAGGSPNPEFFANIIRGMTSSLGQQSSNHSIPVDLTNILGSINMNHGQGSTQMGASNSHGPAFTSFPTNVSVPPDFANTFGNMGSGTEGNQARERSSGNEGDHDEPVHVDANVHINLGERPEQVRDVLRSVMQMFSSQTGPHEGATRGLCAPLSLSLSLLHARTRKVHHFLQFLGYPSTHQDRDHGRDSRKLAMFYRCSLAWDARIPQGICSSARVLRMLANLGAVSWKNLNKDKFCVIGLQGMNKCESDCSLAD